MGRNSKNDQTRSRSSSSQISFPNRRYNYSVIHLNKRHAACQFDSEPQTRSRRNSRKPACSPLSQVPASDLESDFIGRPLDQQSLQNWRKPAQMCGKPMHGVRLYTREIRNRQKKSNIYSHPHPQPDWNAGEMCAISPRSCSPRVSLRSLARRSNIHHPTPAESRGCSTLHHGGPHHRARFPQWPRWSPAKPRRKRCDGLMDQDPLLQMRGILDELVPEKSRRNMVKPSWIKNLRDT